MLGFESNKELPKDSTRLAAFLQDCLLLGSLRGFRHFETLIRAREELILYVTKDKHQSRKVTLMPQHILEDLNPTSHYEPFNPTDDNLYLERNRIVFLIAGYTTYRCPYVWLRSHKEEYLQSRNEDYPLHLKKTMDWKNKNVFLWEVVDEILFMTTKPENPFEIDFTLITHLPLPEAIMLIHSLLSFLKAVWVQANSSIAYSSQSKNSLLQPAKQY
ncbi:hypothetical protein BD560DRAFT_412758 [Blakeslea trispora]|nr:hypothetical protein BD560DRAFT_412758 [Blakeslea trispora]